MSAARAQVLPRPALALALVACMPFAGGCADTELRGGYFVSAPVTGAVASEEYRYEVRTAAVNPDDRTFRLLTAPTGMAIDGNGLITWTPSFAELGEENVRVEVTDGDQSIVQSWVLKVHQNLLFGVNYSPKGHTGSTVEQDEVDFAAEHEDFGKLVGYMGHWRDSIAEAGTIPAFATAAMEQAVLYNYTPVIGFAWADGSGVPDLTGDGLMPGTNPNDWTNQETRDEFLMMVEGFASTYQPRYLYLGYEVNTWALANGGDWTNWLSQLEECTTAIKAVSPGTYVFTTFQHEHMKGLGDNQGWSDPNQWNLLDDLNADPFLDGVGFTSHPHFHYDDPATIPTDFYDEITMHWDGDLLFTELGWPTVVDGLFPGSEAQQDSMMGGFMTRIEGLPVELALWLYLHDFDGQAGTPGYMGIGMRSNDGMVVRPSETTWKAAVELRERP